jgi:O-antigen/teichoic acid export membrane protein
LTQADTQEEVQRPPARSAFATLAWAFLERIVPRIGSAAIMLIFAAVTSPTIVGYYSAMTLAYLAMQALFDSAVRQIAVGAVHTPGGVAFLRRYIKTYALTGPAVMFGALAIMCAFGSMTLRIALELSPMVLAPVAVASATRALATAQAANLWRRISLTQAVAVIASCTVTIPVVIVTESPLGSALQLLMSETIFALGVRRMARGHQMEPGEEPLVSYFHQFRAASAYTLVSWAQNQADRLFLGLFAGSATLGSYSFAGSLSHQVTDSLGVATANVLRPKVIDGKTKSDAELRHLVMPTLRRAMVMTVAVILVTFPAAYWVAPLVFKDDWDSALQIVPVLSISAVPALVSWCLSPVLVYQARLRLATAIKVCGTIMSVGVAVAATYSLELAAWVVVARETIIMCAIALIGTRRSIGARVLVTPVLLVVVLSGLFLLGKPLYALFG